MQIYHIDIRNFRAIRGISIDIHRLSTLVGANNCGKSTILKAIDIFFDAGARVNIDDFHRKNVEDPIDILLSFWKLTDSELEEFGAAVVDGTMTVSRQFSIRDHVAPNYSVKALVFPPFAKIRSNDAAAQRLQAYREIQKDYDLPPVRSAADVDAAMSVWEKSNAEKLELVSIRGFFGATNVANGKLKKRTSLRFIPAVRDSSEEARAGKKSPVIELLADITRQTFENREELKSAIFDAEKQIGALTDPSTIPQLAEIGGEISSIVQYYYGDSSVVADWEKSESITVNFPKPRILVTNEEITTDVDLVGHGLQRIILFSLVQYMAERVAMPDSENSEFTSPQSDIVLLVEEPEIYQHPIKQIVLYRNFKRLVSSFNKISGIRIQIILATHSEKFVSMPDFEVCNVIKKLVDSDNNTINSVGSLRISECATAFANFAQPPVLPMSSDSFAAKLHIFSREICEGFFADRIVLVEGETDRAVLEAFYAACGRDIDLEGIQVISVGGKGNLDKPAYIFDKVGIPTYVIFDNDNGEAQESKRQKKIRQNRFLQRVLGVQNVVDMPIGNADRCYAFDGNLEAYLISIIGLQSYESQFNALASEWGMLPNDLKKTPHALAQMIRTAMQGGYQFGQLAEIVSAVDGLVSTAMKNNSAAAGLPNSPP